MCVRIETGDLFDTMLDVFLTIPFILLSFWVVREGLIGSFEEGNLFSLLLVICFGVNFLEFGTVGRLNILRGSCDGKS